MMKDDKKFNVNDGCHIRSVIDSKHYVTLENKLLEVQDDLKVQKKLNEDLYCRYRVAIESLMAIDKLLRITLEFDGEKADVPVHISLTIEYVKILQSLISQILYYLGIGNIEQSKGLVHTLNGMVKYIKQIS